jgi:hypothetical protein
MPGMLGTDDGAREATILAHSHSAYHSPVWRGSSADGRNPQLDRSFGHRSIGEGVFLAGWVGELEEPLSELHH